MNQDDQDKAVEEIEQFIERYERLDKGKSEIMEDMKEVMKEAKGKGYDVKALKRIIARRKKDREDAAEEDRVYDFYKEILGM